ncbi:hypothetical protein LOD99_14545 [Oopsacas minuta]|uniref:Uncharacterized protein n=1 Tax=Oopsacas minuta TaxID=111878 RepID=A0AAV7KEJ1_9METZ|nr:hypothetical protein LOD99_14545 [Oopsacas minuta]
MRFIDNDRIKEELLFVDYFECRCTGQDIFKMVRSYFDSHHIGLSQVISVSTDGARNMTGRDTGFLGCFKRDVPQCSFNHCMLHKQALAAKNLQPELHETLNLVIKVVNFVKSSPLNEHQKHFFETEEFSSIYLKLKSAYHTEIFSYYNLSNLRLQGDGIFLQAAIENVTTFQNKLKFFRLRILSNQWNMFPRVEAIPPLSPHLEFKFTSLVEENLMNLVTDFPIAFRTFHQSLNTC